MKPILFLLIPLRLLLSCQNTLYHTAYIDLPHNQWDSRDTLTYPLPVSDHDLDTHATIHTRTTATFPYTDIILHLEVLRDSIPISSTRLPIHLSHHNQSLSKGLSIMETTSEPQPLHLQAHHHYTLRLTHLMRLNPLQDITSVGIFIEE